MANQNGTSSHDTLRGTISNDIIEGLGGDDHLHGLDGNDILRGGDGYDFLTGDSGNDTMDGGALDDWFYGGVGNDVLTGGTGADRFVFDAALNATTNVDRITDFTTGSDKIWLNHSVFNKLTVNGALNASMLRIGSAAADSNDYIIYNKDTGALIYDSNGSAAGGAVQFATIGKGLNLTASDFNVFGVPSPTPTAPTPTAGVVTKVGAGSDTLTLKISQDAYQGDAQYAVYVDGKQIGGTFTAKALHSSGQFDTLEIKGDWGVGNHTVGVKLLNDLYGGSATADRNVYVESASYNGSAVTGSYQYINASDTKSFTVADSTAIPSASTPIPTPTPTPPPTNPTPTPTTGVVTKVGAGSDTLTLKISQDAYQGDAQYAVYVDGKQIGGTFTAKALHSSGQFDTLEIKGDWGAGNHTVGVKLLNDLYGGSATADRNVYVESASYNGSAVTGGYQYINASDTKSFAVADSTAIPSASTPTPAPTPTPVPPPTPTVPAGGIKLTKTTAPIKSSFAGQVIENMDIWVDSGDAVAITHDNVILKNCRIHFKTGDGVNITNAKGVQILNCEIINSDPPTGINGESNTSFNCIEGFNAPNLRIDHVEMHDGASGIYIQRSPNALITNIEGHNFHGPFPRGQLVQIADNSDGSTVDGFYYKGDLTGSRSEDNINVFYSNNVTIKNGVIDGNNSPSGVGVIFEGDSSGGYVKNVDVVHQSNGGFSSYSNDVTFEDVRVFDGHMNQASGLGAPASNGLSFAITASGVSYIDATYTRPANPGNIYWGSQPGKVVDITADPAATVMNVDAWIHNWNWIV